MGHHRYAASVVVIGMAAQLSYAAGQDKISMNLVATTSPPEILACRAVQLNTGDDDEAAKAISTADAAMLLEGSRIGIEKIGEPFIKGYAKDQSEGKFPLTYDYCMAIEKTISNSSSLTIVDVNAQTIRIGYCASPDMKVCQASLRKALDVVPTASANPSSLSKSGEATPSVSPTFARIGPWYQNSPPKNIADLVSAVYKLQPIFLRPSDSTARNDGIEVRDNSPRALGQPAPQSPSTTIDSPTAETVKGFVISVSK